MHGRNGLESVDWAGGSKTGRTGSVELIEDRWREEMFLIKFAVSQVVFVPAEVVSKFMEKSDMHLVDEGLAILLGVIPEVAEEEQDLGGNIVGRLAMGRADKEAENIGFEFGAEDGGGGKVVHVHGDVLGVSPELGG